MITIAKEALEAFADNLEKRGTPTAMIRLGVKGNGCSGFGYAIEFDDGEPKKTDNTWEQNGVKFVIDPKSAVIMDGTTVTYVKTLMREGFDFTNPREASRCGCGKSFTLK